MAFIPDVVVITDYSPATIALVAEAKGVTVSLEQAALPLKEYMLRMSCPVGIIFTPRVLRIYKDRFLGRTQDSIELVGDFPSGELFRERRPVEGAESAVESALVKWLDNLAQTEAYQKIWFGTGPWRSVTVQHGLGAQRSGSKKGTCPVSAFTRRLAFR
jgi:hypothetical protein